MEAKINVEINGLDELLKQIKSLEEINSKFNKELSYIRWKRFSDIRLKIFKYFPEEELTEEGKQYKKILIEKLYNIEDAT